MTDLNQHRHVQRGRRAGDIKLALSPVRIRAWLGDRLRTRPSFRFNPWILFDRRHPLLRRLTIAVLALVAVVVLGSGALWWRLASGPISLDLATPWLTAAIEENLGGRYHVKVGGTQIERDAQGHTAVRLRDIVVRDADGVLVAVAPKAEVGLAGTSLLVARPRAASFRLVDASIVVSIGTDGRINVFAGGERPLISIAVADRSAQAKPGAFSLQSVADRTTPANMLAMLAWIGGLGELGRDGKADVVSGFDGHDLTEIGILNGNLTIDNQRSGQQSKYSEVNLLLVRPLAGGVALSVGSSLTSKSWLLNVAITPDHRGHRHLQLQARKVLLDDLLALRMSDSQLRCDALVSAALQAELAPDGTPQQVRGNVVAEGGSLHQAGHMQNGLPITNLELAVDWDINRRTLRVPLQLTSGAARLTLRAEFAPSADGATWQFALGGGWLVLDPLTPNDEGVVLKRINVRGSVDTVAQRVALAQADLGSSELGGRDSRDVSIALSGNLNYGASPRFDLALVANPMSAGTMKRMWPTFVTPWVRDWVVQHISAGTVTKLEVAINAPLGIFEADGPRLADENISITIEANGAALQPVAGLPAIRDADLTARITGRTAKLSLGKGTIDVSPGRRLVMTNGVFELPDLRWPTPPAQIRFQLDGPVPAAAELLALERLRDFSGTPFDPVTSRGNLASQVQLVVPMRSDLPRGSTQYNINVDLTNFSAEKMLFGQKVEATALQIGATNQGYQIKGEVRVNGTQAQLEYRKLRTERDAELRLQATLDDAARSRFGLNVGAALSGPLPVRLVGRVTDGDNSDSRFDVEADLTPATIDGLLPGWGKPSGKPARAAFTLVRDKKSIRFDDLLIDGQGVLVRGNVELDAKGDVELANFPVFATSDGDKASVRAERGNDGVLRVAVRGDVYDGRNFVKSAMAGPQDKSSPRISDLDLDIRLGVVAGHHGEAIRGLDLRLSRRGGRIRGFSLNAKIGRDTALLGEIRKRVSNGRQVLYFETNDAGALFRFTDLYSRMIGGRVWIGMEPPTPDQAPQDGILQVHDFVIRGEAALDRVVANGPQPGRYNAVEFTIARAEFVRTPGRMTIRDGVVNGPMIGATIEGTIDYARDDVNVRGTLVPLYGLNNMFGQIPIVGLFLGGGSREGLLGITYEVRGPTGNPRPMINPLSAIAPGVLRKFFEFRDPNTASSFVEPTR